MALPAGAIVTRPARQGARCRLLAVLVALALALSCASPRAQQPGELQARVEAAFARLVTSLVRIQGYLIYFDQINRVAVAAGQMTAADADARMRQKGDELFHRDHADSEIDAVMGQHRGQVAAFLGRIRQHVDGSVRWPGNASPETYQPAARADLDGIAHDYDSWMQRRLDPLPLLEAAVAIYAWTQGHATPPAGFDPFAGQRERINRALPTAVAQAILLALDGGRSPADAATAGIGQPPAPPPAGPVPIPGLAAPPPPAPPTAMPPTLPAVVPPAVPPGAMQPPPGLPGPTVMLPPGAACTHRLGPALTAKWVETGGEVGVLGCPVGPEHAVAASPFGTSGSAADFSLGDGGTIVRHDNGSRAGRVFAVHGCNYKLYRQLGGSGGRLGFPISDEYDVPDGRRSDFEGGYITWDAHTGICDAFAPKQPRPGIVPPSSPAAHTPPTLAVVPPSAAIGAPARHPAVTTSRIRVDDLTFDAAVLRAALPTLVVFCTGWSPPCRDIGPSLDELATALAGQLVVAEIDVDASPTTSRTHLSDALIPTLVLFAGGRPLASLVGTFSADELGDWIDATVAKRR